MNEIEYSDRYTALGMKDPDPETMCKGHPAETEALTPDELQRWEEEHRAEHTCDGTHFIVCPDCGGTGLR